MSKIVVKKDKKNHIHHVKNENSVFVNMILYYTFTIWNHLVNLKQIRQKKFEIEIQPNEEHYMSIEYLNGDK